MTKFCEFTKDGKKIVQETSANGVVSVKIDPEGEKADAERTKKLREIMQIEQKNDNYQSIEERQHAELIELLKKGDLA